MAYPVQPTLSELRDAVLAACGISRDGADPTHLIPAVNTRIRQAQAIIHAEYPWLVHYVERQFDVHGESDYDIPDDMDPGRVQDVALRVEKTGEYEPLARATALADVPRWKDGKAHRYDLIDQIMRIYPAPDPQVYDKLLVRYYQRPAKLVDDADRVSVDGTAVGMLAEILTKQQLGMKVEPQEWALWERYVGRLRARQSDGSGLLLGGARSVRGLNVGTAYYAGKPAHPWRPW